jgi:hypothetical protein
VAASALAALRFELRGGAPILNAPKAVVRDAIEAVTAAGAVVLRRIAAGAADIAATEEYVRIEKLWDLIQADLDTDVGLLRQQVACTTPATVQPPLPLIPNPAFDEDAAFRRSVWLRQVPESPSRRKARPRPGSDSIRSALRWCGTSTTCTCPPGWGFARSVTI